MMDDILPNRESLPLPALERIEEVCLAFEAAWKQGDNPRIEDYLGAAQGSERSELLRELLLLELDYCSRSDKQPTPDEYQARFPQDSQLVSNVFEELSTGAAVTETSPSPSSSISRGQTLPCQFGDYELLEVLGEGGMGIVYRARQGTPNRIVALKIIRPDRLAVIASEQRDKVVERFRAETQAAASLEHEHIVAVLCAWYQYQDDALYIEQALRERLSQFELECHPEKTRAMSFGRYERENAQRQGLRAHTFDFLGFTHFCGRSRRGKFIVGRRTSRKKFRRKITELNDWLKRIPKETMLCLLDNKHQ